MNDMMYEIGTGILVVFVVCFMLLVITAFIGMTLSIWADIISGVSNGEKREEIGNK